MQTLEQLKEELALLNKQSTEIRRLIRLHEFRKQFEIHYDIDLLAEKKVKIVLKSDKTVEGIIIDIRAYTFSYKSLTLSQSGKKSQVINFIEIEDIVEL